MKHIEAIGLALVIAAVLGGWAQSALDRPGDLDMACVLRLKAGGSEASLWNQNCARVVEMRTLSATDLARPISAGNAQAGNSHVKLAPCAAVEFATALGQPCVGAD